MNTKAPKSFLHEGRPDEVVGTKYVVTNRHSMKTYVNLVKSLVMKLDRY